MLTIRAITHAQELHPGVWASRKLRGLPLAVSGYQVYLDGEMHGVKETEGGLEEYLKILHQASGVRDVVIEESAVCQAEAEAYVEGMVNEISKPLCLRTGFLRAIRQFNEGRAEKDKIRVHLDYTARETARDGGTPGRRAHRDRLRTFGLRPPAPRARRGAIGAGPIHVSSQDSEAQALHVRH